MFGLKIILVAMLSSFLLSAGGPSGCRANQNSNSIRERASSSPVQKQVPGANDLKVLAEGFHSSISEPFIAVIRDAETYDALTKLEGSLPRLNAGFFDSNAVVAAFLGQRNSGGYAVEIARETSGQLRVTERKPGKGMMVPQMITSPFKIISVEAGQNSPLAVAVTLDDAWNARMQRYRITSSTFTSGGGFAGRTEQFRLEGEARVIRIDKLVTLAFEVYSSNSQKKRSLSEFATGIKNDRGIVLQKFSADKLVDNPNPGLQATGSIDEKGLSLQIGSRPTNVADGYSGSGSIDAVAAPERQTPKP